MKEQRHYRYAILIGADPESSRVDEREGHLQASAVIENLRTRGISCEVITVNSDLSALKKRLTSERYFIFNLVEEIEGEGRLAYLVPAMLEALKIPFSGGSSLNIAVTTDKIWTKQLLQRMGLRTAPWSLDGFDFVDDDLVIIKPNLEDASFGIDETSIVPAHAAKEILRQRNQDGERVWFAERYLPGRELTVSLLTTGGRLKVLPAVELLFHRVREQPQLLTYHSKWNPLWQQEFRYDCLPEHDPLSVELTRMAREVAQMFCLQGYARIDFRLDNQQKPHILEINVNPSITANSEFMVAVKQAGFTFDDVVTSMMAGSSTVRSEPSAVQWRQQAHQSDIAAVRKIVAGSGFFNEEEVTMAIELLEANLSLGSKSGYDFLFAESDGVLLGYACYGRIMGTDGRYDLYWIAIDPAFRRQGLGAQILRRVEAIIVGLHGKRVYVQTGGRNLYKSTQAFYEAMGYQQIATLTDYYAKGDDQLIFQKDLS